jgi:hypothetical protein
VIPSVERHYKLLSTFLRACRHYRTTGRRILAYIRHAEGWTLVLDAMKGPRHA